MAIIAANCTEETIEIITKLLMTDEFRKFSLQNKLNLEEKTVLIRLALINLAKNLPTNEEVASYRAALLLPSEFDDYFKEKLGMEVMA